MIDIKKAEAIYKKSIEVIKKVQLKNGGCLATPKGERYPYVYPRDHAIIILGFLSAGDYKRAKGRDCTEDQAIERERASAGLKGQGCYTG